MTLLWVNLLATAFATTVWGIWALRWQRRGDPTLVTLYSVAAIGSLVVAIGFMVVIANGDPTQSATGISRTKLKFTLNTTKEK